MKKFLVVVVLCSGAFLKGMERNLGAPRGQTAYQSLSGETPSMQVQAIEVKDEETVLSMPELSALSAENQALLDGYSPEMLASAMAELTQDADYQVLLRSQEGGAAAGSAGAGGAGGAGIRSRVGNVRQRAEQEFMVKLRAKLLQQKKSENNSRNEELRTCGPKECFRICLPSSAAILGVVLAAAGLITQMARTPECPR
jgi:hypothetical protein